MGESIMNNNKTILLKRIYFLTILNIVFILGNFSYAKTVYVDGSVSTSGDGTSWSQAMKTISEGLVEAASGDKVWVAEGIYQEGAEISIPTDVTLYGGFDGTEINLFERDFENNPTIIDGEDSYRCVYNYGILDGVHVTNGYTTSNGGGIWNSDMAGTVTNCSIYNNTSYG